MLLCDTYFELIYFIRIFTQTKTNSLRTSIEQVAVVSNEPYSNQEEIPSYEIYFLYK
jgi:hypothetical protein